MKKDNEIVKQNNFTEFLLYTTPNGKVRVEIFLKDEKSTCAKIAQVQKSVNPKNNNIKSSFKVVISILETTAILRNNMINKL